MTNKLLRPIVTIDESKCNGCGQCVTSCAEGALQIIDGKVRLVSETYCDGLGACLGECPQGAITVEQKEAEAFDEAAVTAHLASQNGKASPGTAARPNVHASKVTMAGHACPGSQMRMLRPQAAHALSPNAKVASAAPASAIQNESALVNWPVQLSLLPAGAPYLQNADLLISADCVPFALPDFHSRFLSGRTLAIGCPKLDDVMFYRDKLAEIFRRNEIASIHVVYMEVPCCTGLVRAVQSALVEAGKDIPLTLSRIGIDGEVQETQSIA